MLIGRAVFMYWSMLASVAFDRVALSARVAALPLSLTATYLSSCLPWKNSAEQHRKTYVALF